MSGYRLPVYNCSGGGLLDIKKGDLGTHLAAVTPDATQQIRTLYREANESRKAFNVKLGELQKAREALWQ